MQFYFPPDWEVGANTRVVFGRKEGESWNDLWVPAPLIWVCASLVVDLSVSPIATVLVTNGKTHMTQWNKRVPDQWVGVGAGSWSDVLMEAVHRKYDKKKVYWIRIGSTWGGGCQRNEGEHDRQQGGGVGVLFNLVGCFQ